MYCYNDGSVRSTHPIRHSVTSAFLWLLLHLPLSAGLLVGGHVSAASVAESEMGSGRRWLWGGGLAVGFLGMFILTLLWKDNDPPGKLLLSKPLVSRVALFLQLVTIRGDANCH